MFDRPKIHLWLAGGWVFLFVSFWIALGYALPFKLMMSHLDKIESNIVQEDWSQAKSEISKFNKTWNEKRVFIQIANGSEQLNLFEQSLGQLKTLVKLEDDDALNIIGGLKSSTKSITTVFPGP